MTGSCNERKCVVASSDFYAVNEKCLRSDVTIVKKKRKSVPALVRKLLREWQNVVTDDELR